MKRLNASQAGFSIIDMIMGLSILAIAIVGIQIAQNNYINMSNQVEISLRGISLGNSVMNLIRMHPFDENSLPPWSATLGQDSGESALVDNDDIDDYAGASWDFSADGFPGYIVTSRVFCINKDVSWLDSVATGLSFKRIIVSVNHPQLESPLVFSSLMAGVTDE
ncbi:MAG: hypothetical protein HQ506_05095 [Candidatus Marinimicrobia bacterium]|nr:hypothetical protein [Candidatus Neomarinimicrobiota bacterium]